MLADFHLSSHLTLKFPLDCSEPVTVLILPSFHLWEVKKTPKQDEKSVPPWPPYQSGQRNCNRRVQNCVPLFNRKEHRNKKFVSKMPCLLLLTVLTMFAVGQRCYQRTAEWHWYWHGLFHHECGFRFEFLYFRRLAENAMFCA